MKLTMDTSYELRALARVWVRVRGGIGRFHGIYTDSEFNSFSMDPAVR